MSVFTIDSLITPDTTDIIDIQWIGHRKDGSSRGSVWGWFVLRGSPTSPEREYMPLLYRLGTYKAHIAYVIRGRIGKSPQIEEHILTDLFISDSKAKSKNYRQMHSDVLLPKCGKLFNDELDMFRVMATLKR